MALAIVDAFTEFKERGPDPVADTEGSQGPCPPPPKSLRPTSPSRKSVESKAGKRDFKNS